MRQAVGAALGQHAVELEVVLPVFRARVLAGRERVTGRARTGRRRWWVRAAPAPRAARRGLPRTKRRRDRGSPRTLRASSRRVRRRDARRTRTGAAAPAPRSATSAAGCCRWARAPRRSLVRACWRSMRPTTASRKQWPGEQRQHRLRLRRERAELDPRAATERLQRGAADRSRCWPAGDTAPSLPRIRPVLPSARARPPAFLVTGRVFLVQSSSDGVPERQR